MKTTETVNSLAREMSLMLGELLLGDNSSEQKLAALKVTICEDLNKYIFIVGVGKKLPRPLPMTAVRLRNFADSMCRMLIRVYGVQQTAMDEMHSQLTGDILCALYVSGMVEEARYLELFDQRLAMRTLAYSGLDYLNYYDRLGQ